MIPYGPSDENYVYLVQHEGEELSIVIANPEDLRAMSVDLALGVGDAIDAATTMAQSSNEDAEDAGETTNLADLHANLNGEGQDGFWIVPGDLLIPGSWVRAPPAPLTLR